MRLIINSANQFKIKQDLLWMIVTTFVTIIIWIGYSIYLAYHKPTLDTQVTSLLTPLEPTLNKEALKLLAERIEVPSDFTILVKNENLNSDITIPFNQETNLIDSNEIEQVDTFSTPEVATISAEEL